MDLGPARPQTAARLEDATHAIDRLLEAATLVVALVRLVVRPRDGEVDSGQEILLDDAARQDAPGERNAVCRGHDRH
jgi:hypothetical protein